MSQAYFEKIVTPLGELAIVVDAKGRLLAIAFLNQDRKPGIVQTWAKTRASLTAAGYSLNQLAAITAPFRGQLEEYFRSQRRNFDVELAPQGTPFQQEIWQRLLCIPCGQTRTYSELAAEAGRPRAARAVGRAVATNPISIVIPCHRVVGVDGSLTGYAGGLRFKAGLLELEASGGRGLGEGIEAQGRSGGRFRKKAGDQTAMRNHE